MINFLFVCFQLTDQVHPQPKKNNKKICFLINRQIKNVIIGNKISLGILQVIILLEEKL